MFAAFARSEECPPRYTDDCCEERSRLFRQRSVRTDPEDGSFLPERTWLINGAGDEKERS